MDITKRDLMDVVTSSIEHGIRLAGPVGQGVEADDREWRKAALFAAVEYAKGRVEAILDDDQVLERPTVGDPAQDVVVTIEDGPVEEVVDAV